MLSGIGLQEFLFVLVPLVLLLCWLLSLFIAWFAHFEIAFQELEVQFQELEV